MIDAKEQSLPIVPCANSNLQTSTVHEFTNKYRLAM
jgi:hypothetical protein